MHGAASPHGRGHGARCFDLLFFLLSMANPPLRQFRQPIPLAVDHGFLLGARPSLDLPLSLDGIGDRVEC
jgi:hypothetical protein